MMRALPLRHAWLVLAALCALHAASAAAVPTAVNFQGLLLDSGGSPVTGSANLVLRLFAAPTGGTALWSESHPGVSVQDGVYDLKLGSVNPLTQTLLENPALYLEVEVDGDVLAPRQQLLAVPYALRAETALGVDDLPSGFVTQLIEHVNFDGGGPGNLDPSEGLDDPDGDGIANFVDPDNDNDGFSDIDEVAAGTDINLVTPDITGFDPATADGTTTTTVQVSGTGFVAPLSVVFGSQAPTAVNVTSTSFDVDVGPQPEGTVSVQVTNANGETDSSSYPFFEQQPLINSFVPPDAPHDKTTTVTVNGSEFEPGLTVQFGSLSPTPMNLTPTSFQVDVGPNPGGVETVNVTVTNPNGLSDVTTYDFVAPTPEVFVTAATLTPDQIGGIAGADAICASEASAAGLPGTFLAWLGDGITDPASRFTQSAGSYRLVTGTIVANDWADLTDGTLDAPINRRADGSSAAGQNPWTGVNPDGTSPATNHCSAWTSASGSGRQGDTNATNSSWTSAISFPCSTPRSWYCFEQ